MKTKQIHLGGTDRVERPYQPRKFFVISGIQDMMSLIHNEQQSTHRSCNRLSRHSTRHLNTSGGCKHGQR